MRRHKDPRLFARQRELSLQRRSTAFDPQWGDAPEIPYGTADEQSPPDLPSRLITDHAQDNRSTRPHLLEKLHQPPHQSQHDVPCARQDKPINE